jgi:hypothetical protein
MPENNYYNKNDDFFNKNCPTLSHKKEIFQKRYKRVFEVLSSKPLSFNEVVKQSGLNSRYAKHCLDFLVAKNKVNRTPEAFKERKGTRGAPKVFYSICLNTNQQKHKPSADTEFEQVLNPIKSKLPSGVAVEVEFSKLKTVCKNGKENWCKQKKSKCALSECPLVLHIRLFGS